MTVGGWADGFTNAVFQLLRKLDTPRLGLIGPWGHKYPHKGIPGPAIGFLQEALRWWDHWLKGTDTGIMDEPMLRAWVQDSEPPHTSYQTRSGRWVMEQEWPSDNISEEQLPLQYPGRLGKPGAGAGQSAWLDVQSPLSLGFPTRGMYIFFTEAVPLTCAAGNVRACLLNPEPALVIDHF